MIKTYFDNTLINDDSYVSLNNEYKIFDKSFFLGSTVANKFNLTIDKSAISSQPTEIVIKEGNTNLAVLHIDTLTETKDAYEYVLTDALTLANIPYDASSLIGTEGATLLEIAEDICDKLGITLGTTNFRGYDKNITWYDSNRTMRDYISYIAELNGGFARIGSDGKLYFIKQNTQSIYDIDVDDCEDFNLGQEHVITKVHFENGVNTWTYGNDTGETLYLNSENVYITEESEVQAIYNEMNGFRFYTIDCGSTPINSNVRSGDIITFINGEDEYPTIACYEIEYFGNWTGKYALDINSIKVEETQIVGNSQKIKNISIRVDRDENAITQLVQQTSEQGDRLDEVETKQTATEYRIEVISTNIDPVNGDIQSVKTVNGYTFDSEGFKLQSSEEPYNVLIKNDGTYYKDGEDVLVQITKNGTITKDLVLYGKYYYGVDSGVNIATFTKDDAMFVAEKYLDDNNEEAFGHFYNGLD